MKKYSKEQLRQRMIPQCMDIGATLAQVAALDVATNLQPLLDTAQNIAIYHACDWELSLARVIYDCIAQGKQLYQPISHKHSRIMRFDRYGQSYCEIFHSADYKFADEVECGKLDLILLPLVAVDPKGTRLGRGGGYYDATLARIRELTVKPILCGVGFERQMIDEIPNDNWDIKLDYFVSEAHLYEFCNISW